MRNPEEFLPEEMLIDEAKAFAVQFLKLKCFTCETIYWECPECFCIMKQIAAHDCANDWLENMLILTCDPPEDMNFLYEERQLVDGCDHLFQEL